MKVGDTVKFKKPVDADEEKARFILMDGPNSMGRVKIKLICDLPSPPIEIVKESVVEPA